MDKSYIYEIRIEGCLRNHWSDWFEGLVIQNDPNGETTMSGPLDDQAKLLSVLNKIQALNLTIISMNRLSPDE
jgi:hypothetical protein